VSPDNDASGNEDCEDYEPVTAAVNQVESQAAVRTDRSPYLDFPLQANC